MVLKPTYMKIPEVTAGDFCSLKLHHTSCSVWLRVFSICNLTSGVVVVTVCSLDSLTTGISERNRPKHLLVRMIKIRPIDEELNYLHEPLAVTVSEDDNDVSPELGHGSETIFFTDAYELSTPIFPSSRHSTVFG